MKNSSIKILKLFLTSISLIFFLTGCLSTNAILGGAAAYQNRGPIDNVITGISKRSPTNHKNLTGSNNFSSLVDTLVQKQYSKLKSNLSIDDVVLVSDFVNLDKLTNRSKLGFLLSEHLKNALSNRNIIVKAVELGHQFQYGQHGLNLLTRKHPDIMNKNVEGKFALVGTYTVTTQSLIVFVKLIDIESGNILSSANGTTLIDDEILELERVPKRAYIQAPLVL